MEETRLTLCASDGPVVVTFRPMLSPAQYSELATFIMQKSSQQTAHELSDHLCRLASEWKIVVTCGVGT
jgi:hypothetical protein